MFSRLISLTLVLTLVIINFLFLLLPFAVILYPFLGLGAIIQNQELFLYILKIIIFIISSITIFYFLSDFLFGFSVSFFSFKFKKYRNDSKYGAMLEDAVKSVKKKFGRPFVSILIERSESINAYAVGSLRKKVIILTKALLDTMYERSQNEEEFIEAVKGVLAHEMSHLINGDYLPGMLLHTNDKVTSFVQKLFDGFFKIFIVIFRLIPGIGYGGAFVFERISKVVRSFLEIVNYKIIRNIYKFINIYITRAIEYRSDMDAAKCFGGHSISLALSLIGNGYNSIFSDHPGSRLRIQKVIEVPKSESKKIYPHFIVEFANTIGIAFFIILGLYCGYTAEIWNLLDYFLMLARRIVHTYHSASSALSSFISAIKQFVG